MTAGTRADVYCDLQRKCTSVLALDGPRRGKVVAKPVYSVVHGVTFRILPNMLQQVRDRNRRRVCALARGLAAEISAAEMAAIVADPRAQRVHFNPFRADTFTLDDGTPVHAAELLAIDHKTAYVIGVRTTEE